MTKLFATLFFALALFSCSEKNKIPVHAWMGGPGEMTDQELSDQFKDLKLKGVDGLMYSAGHDPATYHRVGKLVKDAGMEFHTWIPTMVQHDSMLKPEWYAVNRNGESAYDKPAYVSHYQFLCPSKPQAYDFLAKLYGSIADVKEVDGIHLDFIRFPDVILARGLWEKYGLVQDKEYPQFDYCYCDKCVADFKAKSGIDIKLVEDPTLVPEWRQFRYDLITNIVNRLAKMVHSKNKQISAAVFPGPTAAKKMVRQEWNKWNLDAFYPMNYNDFYLEGTDWIGEMVKEESTAVPDKPVYSGLFICPDPENKANEPDPENHGLLPNELGAAISQSMNNGAVGICLFTPGRMTEADWKILASVMYN